jgi:hypothetical protein
MPSGIGVSQLANKPAKRQSNPRKRNFTWRKIPSSAGKLQTCSTRPFQFCIAAAGWLNSAAPNMIELEVYAAGVRDLNKILELDHELEAVPGLRYKVDSNHDIVYLELDEPTITSREIRSIFTRLGLEPRFVGAIPPELRPRSKTELLSA